MAGCWLPRTTLPATGARAKHVVEGMAGMNRSSDEINGLDYSPAFSGWQLAKPTDAGAAAG
jgi:hypothetical protein